MAVKKKPAAKSAAGKTKKTKESTRKPSSAKATAVAVKTSGLKTEAKTVKQKTTKKSAKQKVEPRLVTAELVEPGSEAVDSDQDDFRIEPEGIEGLEEEAMNAGRLAASEDFDDEILAATPIEESEDTDESRLPVAVKPKEEVASSSTDPVTTYLAEIRKYPLLTKEQERELAIRYRETNDSKAAEMLVTSNLRFVVKIAAEYSKFGAKLIDLIQEGNVGLMHAVREFNPYKDVRLITYAVWWIRGYIQEYLMRQYSMVRIGTTQTQRKLFYRLQKEKDLLDRMGQGSDIPLLSSRLGVNEEDVKQMAQRLSGRDVSLNSPLDSENSSSLLDFESSNDVGADERLGHAEELEVLKQNIDQIRPKLNEKETYILDNRILADDPMTLQEIGEHYGVTREAVRQLEARLIKRIRTAFTESVEVDSDAD